MGYRGFGVFPSANENSEPPPEKLAGSWEDVQSLLSTWKEQKPRMGTISALFQSLPSLGPPPENLDLTLLTQCVSELLPHLDPLTLSMIYYWSCKSCLDNPGFLQDLSHQILQMPDLTDVHPKHLVLMIYSGGWLMRHQKRRRSSMRYPGMDAFVDHVARALTSPNVVVQLTEQDLSNSIYSLGLLNYSQNEVIYPLLNRIEQPAVLPRFLEQELANMLAGMASLGLKGHPTVATLGMEVVERERLRIYKEPELCSLFNSFATLDYRNPRTMDILLSETVRSGRIGAYNETQLANLLYSLDQLEIQDPRIWRTLLSEVTLPERLPKFESYQLANIMYAFGRCEYRDPQAMHRLVQEVSHEGRISQYSTRECSLLLYGMSQTKHRDPAVLRMFSQELSRPGRLKEAGLTHKTLSGTLLSLARLGHRDADLIQRYFMEVLIGRNMAEMDAEILAQYIFCLGKFKVPYRGPTEEVVAELLEVPEKLKTLSHRGLGMVIYGLGQLGHEMAPHVKPLTAILQEGIGMIERFSVQDLAMVIYSFGQMRVAEPALIDRMLDSLTRPDRLMRTTTQHLSNVMYGLAMLQHRIQNSALEMLEAELARDSRVKSLAAQELANLIFSIGILQIDDRPGIQRLVEKLTEEATQPERLVQFREMELNCALTGLSHLRYREPTVVVPLLEEITHPARLKQLKDQEIASVVHVMAQLGICPDELCEKLLAEAQAAERLSRYDTNSLIMMIYSLGRLQNQNYTDTIRAFSEILLKSPSAEKMGEQNLANFLYGVTHTRCDIPEIIQRIFHEITKHHRLPRFHGGEILNIMKSVLLLRGRNIPIEGLEHVAKIFAVEMCAASRIPNFTPSQLTQVLHMLSVLRNKNVAAVFPILRELNKAENLHQLLALDVARIVFSVGPLAFVNRKLHPKLALAVKPILKQAILSNGPSAMHCQGITELIVGMSMLGLQDTYLLDNVAAEIVKPNRLRSFRAWHLSRIFYAVGQLRYRNLELLRALAAELSRSDRAQRLDYRHWSNILSAVLMLRFKDESFAKLIEKQIHVPQATEPLQSSM